VRKRQQSHGEERPTKLTILARYVGSTRYTGSARGTGSAQGTIPTVPAQYAIGPIDPAQLITLRARVWNRKPICLLVPAHMPLALLADPDFKQGCRWGSLAYEDKAEAGEVWSVPTVVNFIYWGLERELVGERGPGRYTWVVGFLLGYLAGLAETERLLALVGIAHLCFLLSSLPFEVWSCNPKKCVRQMEHPHRSAIRAYRARVRFYREQGKSFQEAQHLSLAGGEASIAFASSSRPNFRRRET
jgi:hypothetical protein